MEILPEPPISLFPLLGIGRGSLITQFSIRLSLSLFFFSFFFLFFSLAPPPSPIVHHAKMVSPFIPFFFPFSRCERERDQHDGIHRLIFFPPSFFPPRIGALETR